MANHSAPSPSCEIEVDGVRIELRNRYLAAFLAWLVPGAGHYYQRRYSKATLFFICIMTTWILGFALGGGHVVYASWQPGDRRWHYFLQAGVGVAALPALVQGNRMRNHTKESRFGPPHTKDGYKPWWGGFMAPPQRPVFEDKTDEVSAWYAVYGAGYEMGTWYTMIAGLLNILVAYDAFAGPLAVPISGRRKEDEQSESTDDTTENEKTNEKTQESKTDDQRKPHRFSSSDKTIEISGSYREFASDRIQHFVKDEFKCGSCGTRYNPKIHSAPYLVLAIQVAVGLALCWLAYSYLPFWMWILLPLMFGFFFAYPSKIHNVAIGGHPDSYNDVIVKCPKCESTEATRVERKTKN